MRGWCAFVSIVGMMVRIVWARALVSASEIPLEFPISEHDIFIGWAQTALRLDALATG